MISIVMPVKNAAPFLEETLNSIVNQTYSSWELIAIDDHSNDDSYRILKEYSLKENQIKIFKNSEKGIIPALVKAKEIAKGEFISRMDADDIMHPNKLEIFRQKAEVHPNSIITSKVEYFAEDTLNEGFQKYEMWLNRLMVKNNHYSEIYKECVLPSPNWLMSVKLLDRLGGFNGLQYPEDYDLCFKAYQQKIPIVSVNDKLHFWRDYPQRTSRNHPHYADNSFLELKSKYFIQVDYNPDKTLYLWGAGKKGKTLARLLNIAGIDFCWVTDNPKKIGHFIYGTEMKHSAELSLNRADQVIVSVANPQEQDEIKTQLSKTAHEVYLFC